MLKNKVAFITGANGGIGRAIAQEFIKQDAKIICAVRKIDLSFSKFLKKNSKNIISTLVFDLSNEESIKNEINKIKKNIKINVLINCAGSASGSIFELTSKKKLKEVFEINFFSQIYITQLLLKKLKKNKSSSIINIGSVSGIIADRGYLSYGASKSALMFSTKVLANELSTYGIRVNSIAPGITKTKMLKKMDISYKKNLLAETFLKKECNPKQVAALAAFLSSDNSLHITGQIIRIDGGMKA